MSQNQQQNNSNSLILGFFFLTGLTGLAYELVWIRLLILAFGSTQFAITTVLVIFMFGLALGSLIFGRVADRVRSPLKVYALIEIALGVYCMLSPSVFDLVRGIYVSYSAPAREAVQHAGFETSQFALSFAALIIPTTLMGGTLPLLVKYLARSGRVGFHTAVPYAVNTLGAVSGCLATGFVSLYLLGVKSTVYAAGVIDIVVGILVFVIFGRALSAASRAVPEAEPEEGGQAHIDPGDRLFLVCVIGSFAVSGFCSLAYEVLWTRVFALVLGSSVYAFTIMLATFLAGIGFGSLVFAPFADRVRRPVAWFGVLEAVIGLSALVSIFIYRELPFIFFNLKEAFSERFWFFMLLQVLLCAVIMIIPTLSMGAIFPLVGRIITRRFHAVGRSIGDIYSFNTSGSILGSFVGGFILIPVIGTQNGVILVAGINLLLAAVLFFNSGWGTVLKGGSAAVLLALFLILASTVPEWGRTVMTMGLYVNPVEGKKVERIKEGERPDKLLYYREGINAVITVRREGRFLERLTYQANGKQEAMSIAGRPPEAWALLGHIPLLLHGGEPENALLVGLGSGVTLGAMERYPLKEIDVVEIEPAVIEAAGFFKEATDNALEDERVRLHVTDGRSFLFAREEKYDVIVSAVSDPWITGVANLFTLEYFQGLSDKLADDGVVSLWFQNYRITPEELKIGLNTFRKVFPHTSIWFHFTDSLDLIVIGTKGPHPLDMEYVEKALEDREIRYGLGRVGVKDPFDIIDLYIIGGEDLGRYTGETVLNTDERPVFEFRLPKLQYLNPSVGVETVGELINASEKILPEVELPDHRREWFYMNAARSYNDYSFRLPQALELFEKVREINPGNREAEEYIKGLKKELQ